jgi:predicted lactoylglutathione lyase
MSTRLALPAIGAATKAALLASQGGIADCLSPTNPSDILFWLNLSSKAEVDELFAQWKAAHAKIVSEPEDKPWKLREFMAADVDGNLIRVFYDFRGDTEKNDTSRKVV